MTGKITSRAPHMMRPDSPWDQFASRPAEEDNDLESRVHIVERVTENSLSNWDSGAKIESGEEKNITHRFGSISIRAKPRLRAMDRVMRVG